MATTSPDAGDLSAFSTDQLIKDLLRRSNIARSDDRCHEAERLLRAVLAYSPGDGAILQVLGDLALTNSSWTEARDCALRALRVPTPPDVFIRACAIYCCAVYMLDGEAGVRPMFTKLKAKLGELLDSITDPATAEEINIGVTAACCAGDLEFAHRYFMRRFGPWAPPDAETVISSCLPVHDWCLKAGATFMTLDPPRHVTSEGLPPRHGVWDFHTDGVHVAVIPGGQMVSGFDFAFTAAGEMLVDSGHIAEHSNTFWYPRIHADPVPRLIHVWPKHVTEIDESVLFVSCSQNWHVGHWIVDFLPRLRGLALRPDLKIALPTETPRKHRDFLLLFGIDDGRIINCDLNHRYRFRELMVVQTGSEHRPEPSNVSFVADYLRPSPKPAATPLKIFLDRDMKNRAIANRPEFDAELTRLGFQTLNLATLPVAEQREVLSAADVVISTYGSDLLAFYMMNQGATLIELNWDPVAADARVQAKCSVVGVLYYLLHCRTVENPENRLYKKDRDFIVDLAALRLTLITAGISLPASA